MSLATQFAAATDATFLNLIQAAIVQQAVAITSEAAGAADHVNRVSLATLVLRAPSQFLSSFAQAVASQAVDKTATDAVILTAVSSVWDAIAGVI